MSQAGEYLTFNAIAQVPDIVEEDFPVPEWSGKIRLRSLTKAQQFEVIMKSLRPDGVVDGEEFEKNLLKVGVIEPSLSMAQIEEIWDNKQAGAVSSIVDRLTYLSGLTRRGGISKEAVEEAERQFRERGS